MSTQKFYAVAQFEKVKSLNKSDIYTLGALTFTGEHKKARWMAEALKTQSDLDTAFINFHLGLSFTRTSNYKKAAEYFKENRRIASNNSDDKEIQFLAYQGLGFFNFFFSRHKQSLQAAHLAHKNFLSLSASKAKPLYQILCLDLEGHNLIHRYRIHQGLQVLTQAKEVADKNKIQSLSQSLALSILCYRSRYVTSPKEALINLQKTLTNLPNNNDYSRAELIFEISNLLMLTGEYAQAQRFLSQNYKAIYETDNKRQMGKLNFRMTYNMFRQGSFEQALFLAKTARSNLNKITDRGLIAQIIGLEIKILSTMGEPIAKSLAELSLIDEKIDSLLVKRSNARFFKKSLSINKGEDHFGDIVERMTKKKSVQVYQEIVENEMFGLLGDFFDVPPHESRIIINAPKNHTVICSKEKVSIIKKPLGSLLVKLIQTLAKQPMNKEQLIQSIWGYSEYSPLRHDSLIYSSITRMRNLLGLNDQQLIFDGERYKLNIQVVDFSKSSKNKNDKPAPIDEIPNSMVATQNDFVMNINEELNFRQASVLKDNEFDNLSVKNYSIFFDITTMTALRDMKKMCELGYLKKVGKGRATRYLKTYSA